MCIRDRVNWGIIPGGNVSKVFGDMVSFRNALFYAMTGRTIDGRKAVELGIATLSVPAEKLREETVTIARELMARAQWCWLTPNKRFARCEAWTWLKPTNIWAQKAWRFAPPIRNR